MGIPSFYENALISTCENLKVQQNVLPNWEKWWHKVVALVGAGCLTLLLLMRNTNAHFLYAFM